MSEQLSALASELSKYAKTILEGLGTPSSLAEHKYNSFMAGLAAVIDSLAEIVRKSNCVIESKGLKGKFVRYCGGWIALLGDGITAVTRVRPALSIRYDGSRIVFRRDKVTLIIEGRRITLCKYHYCKEVVLGNKEAVIEELPQLNYLLRNVAWHATKSLEGLNACLRSEAPACLRA
ncbi:MAG: hypothetical protein GXO09_05055 [Crenarchaeota archaeon]|nr:hypothetical protein [Thermoproteota archaeon]